MLPFTTDLNMQLNISASVIELLEEKKFGNNETITIKKKNDVNARKSISLANLSTEPIASVGSTQRSSAKDDCPVIPSHLLSFLFFQKMV